MSLDLKAARPIESITIWNRTDGELHRRLDGLVVDLLDEAQRTVWRGRLRRAPRTSREVRPAEHGTEWAIATASASHEQEGFGVDQVCPLPPAGQSQTSFHGLRTLTAAALRRVAKSHSAIRPHNACAATRSAATAGYWGRI